MGIWSDKVAGANGSAPHPRRSVSRRAVVGLGLGVAGASAALLAAAIVTRPSTDDLTSPLADSWFVLRAYADGLSQGGGVVLAQRSVSLAGSLGGSSGSGWYAAHGINLACEGAGIQDITYSIEGDYVSESGQPSSLSTSAVWFDAPYSDPYLAPDGRDAPEGGGTPVSFTVSYEEQAADEDNFNRQIWTSFPSDDEIEAARAEAESKYPGGYVDNLSWEQTLEYERLRNRMTLLLERRSGELLAQTTLVLRASCTDGSTLVRRYAITPRSDFDQVYGEWLEETVEPSATVNLYRDDEGRAAEAPQALDRVNELISNWPDLYTITELAD